MWRNFECVIHPEVTLCVWRDVRNQEITNLVLLICTKKGLEHLLPGFFIAETLTLAISQRFCHRFVKLSVAVYCQCCCRVLWAHTVLGSWVLKKCEADGCYYYGLHCMAVHLFVFQEKENKILNGFSFVFYFRRKKEIKFEWLFICLFFRRKKEIQFERLFICLLFRRKEEEIKFEWLFICFSGERWRR